MNIQNLPRHDAANPDAAIIHRIFRPKLDALMFFDWKSMELVLLAYYQAKALGDYTLRDELMAGVDVHEQNAQALMGDATHFRGIPRRTVAKAFGYSMQYGGGAPTVSEQLGIPLREAQKMAAKYHRERPALRNIMEALEKSYDRKGYIRTLYGRELRVMKKHVLLNYLIQGSCAEIMKRSLVKVHQHFGHDPAHAHLVAAIHDELVLDVPRAEVPDVAAVVPEFMRDKKVEKYLPLEVDSEISWTTWSEKEAYVPAA